MKEIALKLPGIGQVQGYPGIDSRFNSATIGSLITDFASLALMIAAVLMFIWFVWGVFEFLIAGGNKEGMAKARKRMTYAIVGFILFIASFSVSRYVTSLLRPVDRALPTTIERGAQNGGGN